LTSCPIGTGVTFLILGADCIIFLIVLGIISYEL
jgi:hypothetical protein